MGRHWQVLAGTATAGRYIGYQPLDTYRLPTFVGVLIVHPMDTYRLPTFVGVLIDMSR